jgi:hypothetical protein
MLKHISLSDIACCLVLSRFSVRDWSPCRASRIGLGVSWVSIREAAQPNPARPGPALRAPGAHTPHAPLLLSLSHLNFPRNNLPLPLPPLSPRDALGIGDGDHRNLDPKVSSPPLPFPSPLSPSPPLPFPARPLSLSPVRGGARPLSLSPVRGGARPPPLPRRGGARPLPRPGPCARRRPPRPGLPSRRRSPAPASVRGGTRPAPALAPWRRPPRPRRGPPALAPGAASPAPGAWRPSSRRDSRGLVYPLTHSRVRKPTRAVIISGL